MSIPSFTVVDNLNETNIKQDKPTWQQMYETTIIGSNPDYSFVGADDFKPFPEDEYQMYNNTNINNMIQNNKQLEAELSQNKLQTEPPFPLPTQYKSPNLTPPYGTSYPSSGYSAYDVSQPMNANINSFTAAPPVPYGSNPALIDARNGIPVQANPLYAQNNDINFMYREGFDDNDSENYFINDDPSYNPPNKCRNTIHHIEHCHICQRYVRSDKPVLIVIIIFMIILVLILLYVLYKKNNTSVVAK